MHGRLRHRYSSLSYLRRFSLDVLKIDRSFVSDMVSNTESREIVKTILRLGRNLGIEVIAEAWRVPNRSVCCSRLDVNMRKAISFPDPSINPA